MSTTAAPPTAATRLTDQHRTILALIAGGLTNYSIGARLGISASTVADHVRSILRVLQARGRAHAVAIAYERGVIAMPAGSTPRVQRPTAPTSRPAR